MALDGAFLRHIAKELERALGAKVEKVYQPNREELILLLKTREEALRLLLSARANSPRVHFTKYAPENPAVPPMLCMLLRKRLAGAKLSGIYQTDLERALTLEFDAISELGDRIKLRLITEIMGRHSNVVFVDGNGIILDALKRVDASMSSQRLILPGLRYEAPPAQNKLCLLKEEPDSVSERISTCEKPTEISKALLSELQGLSPIVCRELQYLAGGGEELFTDRMSGLSGKRLEGALKELSEKIRAVSGSPFCVVDGQNKPVDFSFFPIRQYGMAGKCVSYESFSELLDAFYAQKDNAERMRVRSQDLLKVLSSASERLSRKIGHQKEELRECAGREKLRIFGDLLNANLYRLEKGLPFADLPNFYEEEQPLVRIPLDPSLSAAQNAQKYYKEYRKAKTAEEVLTVQIDQAEKELIYLDSVFDALSRASGERELAEIREELKEQGYLRLQRGRQKPPAPLGPLECTTSDGFTLLAGRNNRQNDLLTLKQAKKSDLWFHTKNIPGAHIILVAGDREPSALAITEAAQLAAQHSRARLSSQVPVDYTQVRNVFKPQGARPGMVNYVKYRTVYVVPREKEEK